MRLRLAAVTLAGPRSIGAHKAIKLVALALLAPSALDGARHVERLLALARSNRARVVRAVRETHAAGTCRVVVLRRLDHVFHIELGNQRLGVAVATACAAARVAFLALLARLGLQIVALTEGANRGHDFYK